MGVQNNYYDGSPFFRMVKDFVVQFGLSNDAIEREKWAKRKLKDDPVKESNTYGSITFATMGANSRTTQLFINLHNNVFLDKSGFAPFGYVIGSGMEMIQSLNFDYAEKPS